MFDPNQLAAPTISLHTLVMLVFYFVVAVYVVFSAIFYYHWHTYGSDTKVTAYTFIVYFVTTLSLLLAMSILTFII